MGNNTWTYRPLAELCDINIGKTPSRNIKEYWGKGHTWVSISDLKSKSIFNTKEEITNIALTDSNIRMVKKGTLLMSFKLSIGKLAFAGKDLYTNEAIVGLPVKRGIELDSNYLYYALGFIPLVGGNQAAMGKTLNKKSLAALSIPLPPTLDDQKRIAKILSECEELIQMRKDSIELLDELLKSTFLEMFGDIRARKSQFKWEKLRPYLKAKSGKSSKEVKSEEETIYPIYGGNGINGWATKPLYTDPIIIAGRVGQQCGIIHVSEKPCWVTDNAIVIEILNKEKFNIRYLSHALTSTPILEKVKQLDLPFINQSMILDIDLPIPPISLQDRFEQIFWELDKLRSKFKESLQELENLYGSLSQRAFKGELDLSKVDISYMEDSTQEKPEMELEGDPRREGKVEIQNYQVHIDEIIRKDFENSSFSFKQLEDAIAEQGIDVPYESVKEFVFKSLEGSLPLLSQTFEELERINPDSGKKEIKKQIMLKLKS